MTRSSPLVVVLAAAAALLVSSLDPGGAAARPMITGISGLGSDDPIALQRVKQSGARMVQIQVPWSSVAPQKKPANWSPEDPADPNYDWAATDTRVIGAVGAGLTPVILIDGGPVWAQGCAAPPFAAVPLCDPDPEALGHFATAAARRYSGQFSGLPRVRFWQGLNEPNLSLFFNPQFKGGKPVSANLYRALINSFYSGVKSVSASNLVIAAGLGPIAVPRFTIGPKQFTRELLCMKGGRDPKPTRKKCTASFDIFDIHPYTTGGPLHEGRSNDVQLGDLEELQDLLRAADRAGRIEGKFGPGSTWITEFSWDSKPPDPGGLRMKILTRWTAMAMYRAWSAGISRFFWYSLRDSASGAGSSAFTHTIQSGLYFRGETLEKDRPKAVLAAFRFPFVAIPGDGGMISFWGRTPTSQAGRVLVEGKRGGGWKKVVGANAAGSGVFTGKISGAAARGLKGPFRASFRGETSPAFSLKEVRDFYQPPFG